jgi:hypothetical protein
MTKTKKQTKSNSRTRKKRVFKPKDFIAGDGMMTAVWGPPMWHYLHTMSFNYPVNPSLEQKRHYRNFVLNLKNVLPCKYCRQNLKANFRKLPLTIMEMKSRDSFSRYIYELHELVNRMLGKESGLSYCDVRERYEHFRARCTDDKKMELTKEPDVTKEKEPDATNNKKTKDPKTKDPKTKEKGCTEPLYGKKAKCVLSIVPKEEKIETFKVDKECIKSRE